jgi:hypothetical protein
MDTTTLSWGDTPGHIAGKHFHDCLTLDLIVLTNLYIVENEYQVDINAVPQNLKT